MRKTLLQEIIQKKRQPRQLRKPRKPRQSRKPRKPRQPSQPRRGPHKLEAIGEFPIIKLNDCNKIIKPRDWIGKLMDN